MPIVDCVPVETKKEEEVPIVKDAEEVKILPHRSINLLRLPSPFALATPHIAYAVAPTVWDLNSQGFRPGWRRSSYGCSCYQRKVSCTRWCHFRSDSSGDRSNIPLKTTLKN